MPVDVSYYRAVTICTIIIVMLAFTLRWISPIEQKISVDDDALNDDVTQQRGDDDDDDAFESEPDTRTQLKGFFDKQRAHKPKTLRSDRVDKLVALTDETYFKNTLLRPFMQERVPDTDGNRAVQEHIRTTMASLGWSVEEDSFTDTTPYGEKSFTNIIATQNPAAERTITLACHFDSKYFREFTFIGATDSAVPCAMLLDIGHTMNTTFWKENPRKAHDVSLQFIFFDGEEAFVDWTDTDSLYGARHLAHKLHTTNVIVDREQEIPAIRKMDVLVLLDLIGHEQVVFKNWFAETSKLFERLHKIETKLQSAGQLDRTHGRYFSTRLETYGGIQDDHIPFLNRDVPIIHLISSPFPAVWHTRRDDESALHYPTIHNIIKILRVFVAEYLHLSP